MALCNKKICAVISAISAVVAVAFLFLAYSGYLNLKKTLLAAVSDKMTSVIGQQVTIADITPGITAGIYLHDIVINNPVDSGPGQLLRIKRLKLDMQLSYLLKGSLHFKNILVDSPELTLIKNSSGRLNVSDKLRQFLSKKSTLKYQVDKLTVNSGSFGFNKDEKYRITGVNLNMKNLSSVTNEKTLVESTAVYSGTSKIRIAGWIYLKDESKRFNISAFSEDFKLSAFKDFLKTSAIDAGNSKIAFDINADGDMARGFNLKSAILVKNPGSAFVKKNMDGIRLSADAFFNLPDNSVLINGMSLHAGSASIVRLTAAIRDIFKNPAYEAQARIDKLDLSAFNFPGDLKISGIMSSDNIHLKGVSGRAMPEISGLVHLSDAAVRTQNISVGALDADVKLLSRGALSARAEIFAQIMRAGGYSFKKPAGVKLLVDVRSASGKIDLTAAADISSAAVDIRNDRTVSLDQARFTANGTLRDKAFTGRSAFDLKEVRYGNYTIHRLGGASAIDYRKNILALSSLSIATKDFKLSGRLVKAMFQGEGEYSLAMSAIDAAYPEKKAEMKGLNLNITLNTGRESPSGKFAFSSEGLLFQGMGSGTISGSGNFDDKRFHVALARAEALGGKLAFIADGKTSGGPFPLKISLLSENADLGGISRAASGLLNVPYTLSGQLGHISFDGTLDSARSLHGNASLDAKGVSVRKPDARRNVLKDAALNAQIIFTGSDLEFKAGADIKNTPIRLSGTVREFAGQGRTARIRAILPEVKAVEIRNSFWDSFPDALLYAGLDGSLSSEALVDYSSGGIEVKGNIVLKGLMLTGENGEYSAGPVNGSIPLAYSKPSGRQETASMPVFERSEFESLIKQYSREPADGFSRITIGHLNYGFRLLDNINLRVRQTGTVLHIERFSANIFGGKIFGSAVADISGGLAYRAGFLVKDLSMATLSDAIEPIKGYISGKVDGIANLKGAGSGISRLIGKADFWTYSTKTEKTKISREFLRKIGGPTVKAYLRDRPFDKGIMSLYIQDGFVIFRELEISNRNLLGIQDLSVKVAPYNNRIAIDHLMWTMTEAAQRAKKDR